MPATQIRTRELDLDGFSVLVREAGPADAPPLVCLHGGPGMDSRYLLPAAGLASGLVDLATEYRVITYDQRGCGSSGTPDIARPLALSHHVADIERLRSALGLGPIALLGHSFGTVLAFLYALGHPTALTHLVILGGAPDRTFIGGYRNAIENDLPVDTRRRLGEIESAPLTDESFRERFLLARSLYFKASPDPDTIEALFPPGSFSAEVNRSVADDLQTYDLKPALPNIRTPALVIYGEKDRVVQPSYQLQFRGSLLSARFVSFMDSGHFPFLEEADAFARVTRYFLRHGQR